MPGRARFLFLGAILCCGLCVSAGAETRRAILVGINNYNPDNLTRYRLGQAASKAGTVARAPVEGDASYWNFRNLEGALADVELMKTVLGNFGFTDFVILQDQEATADAILAALQTNLVDQAAPGDIRVFYYSGHGNHIRNQASKEHGEDQTLVPADDWRNTPPIRDKEISRILWKAARKGVKVTFIADSCHSASLSRGAWNARGLARTNSGAREGELAGGVKRQFKEPVVNDAADIDPETKKEIDPEAIGVLTLAAAQQNEEALEVETDEGKHGVFTWALSHALKSPKEPMDRVFARALALMRGGAVSQQPVMGGLGRGAKGIFGDDADPNAGLEVVATAVNASEVRLNGGIALGLYPGSTLKSAARPPVTLEITASDGMSGSTAKIVGGGSAQRGDVFTLDRLVMPLARLRVYLPSPMPLSALMKTAAEVGKLKRDPSVGWLADATAGKPTHVMSWNGKDWILEKNPAMGEPQKLGPDPTADAVKQLLPPNSKFLMLLPPSEEFAAAIHSRADSVRVEVRGGGKPGTPAGAQYWLNGRFNGKEIEYAWLLPDSTEETVRALAGVERSARPLSYSPLPLRSDWAPGTAPAESLSDKAQQLARIRAWFILQSPPGQGSFPYHLALRNVATGQFRDVGDMKEGEDYKLFLRAAPAELQAAKPAPRWVYVFSVDHFGKGSLIFPTPGHGNDANHLPYAQKGESPKFEPLIPIAGDSKVDFQVSEPFGVDTYFLITSEDPIDNPGVLEFDGVRTKDAARGGENQNPLTDLLDQNGTGARGAKPRPVPARWSIESVTLRSVPAGQ